MGNWLRGGEGKQDVGVPPAVDPNKDVPDRELRFGPEEGKRKDQGERGEERRKESVEEKKDRAVHKMNNISIMYERCAMQKDLFARIPFGKCNAARNQICSRGPLLTRTIGRVRDADVDLFLDLIIFESDLSQSFVIGVVTWRKIDISDAVIFGVVVIIA